ncbi:conserved hypothetical protein [Anaeromyxobacter sp. Fw109-5]|nr:conserved hypothetical protein [Anaeromyxobacter sp. Fw109-5]
MQATVPSRLPLLAALAPLTIVAPRLAFAQPGARAGAVEPATPPPPALVSPVEEVAPSAPRARFGLKLPRKEAPEAPGAPPAIPEEQPEERARERAALEDNWLDATHAFVAEQLFAPVLVFDRFFSDETALDAERSTSFFRWRNELRLEEGRVPTYTTALRADLRLPGFNRLLRRLRLVVEGQTRDAFTTMFGEDTEEPEPAGSGGAELRLRFWEGLIAHGDLGAGVLLQLPPGGFARARLRWAIPVGDLFLTRLATTGFWRTDTHFGTSVDAHLERGIKRAALLRLSGSAQLTEVSPGVEWSTELMALRAFTRTVFGSVGVGMRGATDLRPEIDRYRVATRLRTDVYRRWLFVEAEPEVFWPWTPEAGRAPQYAVTFRVEVQFRGWDAGSSPQKPPAAAEQDESDEPADPPAEPAGADAAG